MFHKLINQLENCQLKFSSDEKGVFEGYASVFDSVDKVGDTIAKGAFLESIESRRTIKMFVNHAQHDVPVGDWVQMVEDNIGLKATGRIDLEHKDGPTVYSALKRGAMDGLSIGFTMNESDFDKKGEGRLIKNLNLMETSIVSFPCEGQARISAVKADLMGFTTLQDYEHYLREVGGFSKSVAVALVSQIVKVVRSDSELQVQQNAEEVGTKVSELLINLRKTLRK
ncbi:MAG TPA: HK97 family phage prohead protease [Patescibacteria group bacterium]|nr:HK97 family phage prohead protease [Patescibacteria group bacterium]